MTIFTFTYNMITVDYVSVIVYTSNKKLNTGDKYYIINDSVNDTFYTGLVRYPQGYEII